MTMSAVPVVLTQLQNKRDLNSPFRSDTLNNMRHPATKGHKYNLVKAYLGKTERVRMFKALLAQRAGRSRRTHL